MYQFDIRIEEDRKIVSAIKYTSNPNSCPFYDFTLNSKCKLDSSKVHNCSGICFEDGAICIYVAETLEGFKREKITEGANETLMFSFFGVSILLNYNFVAIIAALVVMLYGYYRHRTRTKKWINYK